MANKTNSANGTSVKKLDAEIYEWYEKNKNAIHKFAKANEALLNLKDVGKDTRYRTIQKISRDDLSGYLENPNSYEDELRNIARYLVTRSQIFYRLVKYYANQFRLDARSVIPNYSLTDENDKDKILESYESTLKILDKMNLELEFLKAYSVCMVEDVYFGCKFFNENAENGNSLFFLQMPPNYCRLQGIFSNGTLAYTFNMDFFKKNKNLLELWGEPFKSMMEQSEKENSRWILMPQEYSVCLKFRIEDLDLILSPFAGLFDSLLALLELEDIANIAAEQEIYKLLVATIPTISNSDEPNDFSVDPSTAVQYFNKMCDALPAYTDAIISPIPVDYISFDKNSNTNDINRVQNATKTVLNTSGGSQVLNSAGVSSSSGYEATFKLDTEFAISSLLPQTEAHVNYWISQYVKNPAKVKFFRVSTYTAKQFRDELLVNAQNSLPTKLAIASMSGFSELDTLALNFLEEDVLNLSDKFKNPLSTSYTQSNKDGKEEKDVDELSDSGELTRDQDKNNK